MERTALVRVLIEHGADVDFRGEENTGVVFAAALLKDAAVMDLVLSGGAEPNLTMDDPEESVYDWAVFDYHFCNHEDRSLPPGPRLVHPKADQASPEAWLDYLDRAADVSGKTRPEFLRVMRRYGAMTARERQAGPGSP